MKGLKRKSNHPFEKNFINVLAIKNSQFDMPHLKVQSKINKEQILKNPVEIQSLKNSSLIKIFQSTLYQGNINAKEFCQEKQSLNLIQTLNNQSLPIENSSKNIVSVLQEQLEIMKKQKQLLFEIIKFEEEKTSTAIQYIVSLHGKLADGLRNIDKELYQVILNVQTQNSQISIKNIKENQEKIGKRLKQLSPIQENSSISQHYSSVPAEKNTTNSSLKAQLQKLLQQNHQLKTQVDDYRKKSSCYQFNMKRLDIQNIDLKNKLQNVEKSFAALNLKYQKSTTEINQVYRLHNLSIKETTELRRKLLEAEGKLIKLKQIDNKNFQSFISTPKNRKSPQCFQAKSLKSQIQESELKYYQGVDPQKQYLKHQINNEYLGTCRQLSNENYLTKHKSVTVLSEIQGNLDPKSAKKQNVNMLIARTVSDNQQSRFENNQNVEKKTGTKLNYQVGIENINNLDGLREQHRFLNFNVDDEVDYLDQQYEIG